MTNWQRFRLWRRGRPFWGGLLTVLAGLEIISTMHLELLDGMFIIGNKGMTAYLIGFILIISGPLAWYAPQLRMFYGLLSVFVAVFSLLEINLGGFFIGMLLGLIGGGLIFSWKPTEPVDSASDETVPDEENPSEEAGTEVLEGVYLRDGVPSPRQAPEEEGQPAPKADSPRHAALLILAVALSMSMLAVIGAQTNAGAVGARAAAGPCGPTPTASASPSPSKSSGSGGGIIGGIIDWFGRIISGGSGTSPSPSASPKPTATPTPCPTPTGTNPGGPGGPGVPGSPGAPNPGAPGGGRPGAPQAKAEACTPRPAHVAKHIGKYTGSRVTMDNLVFAGVCAMPRADGSTIDVLHFTLTNSDTNDFRLVLLNPGDGQPEVEIRANVLTVKGNTVHFYAARFRGNLFGLIPQDYSPSSLPPPIPLLFVLFTNPVIDLVWVHAPALPADNLRITGV